MAKVDADILYHKVGLNNNLRDIHVKEIIESQYEFVKDTMNSLELKEVEESEFDELKTNFIFKYFGKLYTNYSLIKKSRINSKTYKRINKRWEK